MYDDIIYQGADPGANIGGAFTASINERELVPKGKYLHELKIGLGATTSTAAVTLDTALDLLNPFILKAGAETRIQLRGRDLLALNIFMYAGVPQFWAANATSDNFAIMGLRVPVWETIDPNKTYAWSATRAAQTNMAAETIEVASRWNDAALQPKPIYAIEQPFTTPGATGRTQLNIQLPSIGKLIGLMVFNNTDVTNTANTAGVQRLQLYMNGQRFSQYNRGTSGAINGFNQDNQELLMHDVYKKYMFIDLRESPLDAKANQIGVEIDCESTSASARLIPIFQGA
jgi:hypothetical protein